MAKKSNWQRKLLADDRRETTMAIKRKRASSAHAKRLGAMIRCANQAIKARRTPKDKLGVLNALQTVLSTYLTEDWPSQLQRTTIRSVRAKVWNASSRCHHAIAKNWSEDMLFNYEQTIKD